MRSSDQLDRASRLLAQWDGTFEQDGFEQFENRPGWFADALGECLDAATESPDGDDRRGRQRQRAVNLINLAGRRFTLRGSELVEHGNPTEEKLQLACSAFLDFLESDVVWWLQEDVRRTMFRVAANIAGLPSLPTGNRPRAFAGGKTGSTDGLR